MRHDLGSKFGLNGKNVIDNTIITPRPDMSAAPRVDELGDHTDLLPGASGAAFYDISGA